MAPVVTFSPLSLWKLKGEFMYSILHLLPLIYWLFYIYLAVWIQIQIGPEYGSGSTT